jgi:hypothetical protein
VEWDEQLRRVGKTLLEEESSQPQEMVAHFGRSDGIVLLVTSSGTVFRIQPQETGPARIQRIAQLGAFGSTRIAAAAIDERGRRLVAAGSTDTGIQNLAWFVYDLDEEQTSVPSIHELSGLPTPVFRGPMAVDSSGRMYLAGTYSRGALEIPSRVLAFLRDHDYSDAKRKQLLENGTRTKQPLLFAVEVMR